MTTSDHTQSQVGHGLKIGKPVFGDKLKIGAGFNALSFREHHFDGLMNPLLMVDHFFMTEPTFGTHPHAGMSAVSVLFEDSQGAFNNRDSLGNDIDLMPGDLYWLGAGRGSVHNESPVPGAQTHALQVFVDLPERFKQNDPFSLHVKSAEMPVLEIPGCRIRVVLGTTGETSGKNAPALPLTILDGILEPGASFFHSIPENQGVWLHPIRGTVEIKANGVSTVIPETASIAMHSHKRQMPLEIRALDDAQFVLISGAPIRKSFAQK